MNSNRTARSIVTSKPSISSLSIHSIRWKELSLSFSPTKHIRERWFAGVVRLLFFFIKKKKKNQKGTRENERDAFPSYYGGRKKRGTAGHTRLAHMHRGRRLECDETSMGIVAKFRGRNFEQRRSSAINCTRAMKEPSLSEEIRKIHELSLKWDFI